MHPPRKWTEKWAYDHPWQALLFLAFGAATIVFALWLLVAG